MITGCPKEDDPGNGGDEPSIIMDLTMEADTDIESYISASGYIYTDMGSSTTGTLITLATSTEQAHNGNQSLKNESDLDVGATYAACETRVKLDEVTGSSGDLTNYTISVYLYVPHPDLEDPDYVQFVLWDDSEWLQLQSPADDVVFDAWTEYTLTIRLNPLYIPKTAKHPKDNP